jgi:hypothetical protein
MSLVTLLLTLVVVCLFFWAARAILAAFSIGDPIATVVYVVLVLIVILWLIGQLGGGTSLGNLRLGR